MRVFLYMSAFNVLVYLVLYVVASQPRCSTPEKIRIFFRVLPKERVKLVLCTCDNGGMFGHVCWIFDTVIPLTSLVLLVLRFFGFCAVLLIGLCAPTHWGRQSAFVVHYSLFSESTAIHAIVPMPHLYDK